MNWKPIMRLLCHQREDRSYKICNEYLIVCGRCLGIYVGFFFSLVLLLLFYSLFAQRVNYFSILALFLPMGIDGVTQLFGLRESSNKLRFITGYLAGIGVAYMFYFIASLIFAITPTLRMSGLEFFISLALMPIFLIVLKKSSASKKLFLHKFFNFISIFSAAIMIFGIAVFYAVFLFHKIAALV